MNTDTNDPAMRPVRFALRPALALEGTTLPRDARHNPRYQRDTGQRYSAPGEAPACILPPPYTPGSPSGLLA